MERCNAMNETPIANRLHIGIFGRRNAGKSSFINALTGQDLAIVDKSPGTTTDPVGKAMEVAGLGPVYIYDTAGIDDEGELGDKRVAKTREIIRHINLAVIITTYLGYNSYDDDLIKELKSKVKEVVVFFNKIDVEAKDEQKENALKERGVIFFSLSCTLGKNIDEAREILIKIGSKISVENKSIIGDLISPGDFVVLVVPIDLGAPKGRLILPQVQVIRDCLDNDAVPMVVKDRELQFALQNLSTKPGLVICDSQVVLKTAGDVPVDIKLSTFSILFSRLKGDLAEFVRGVKAIDRLQDGDKVLMLEACSHHSQADDIGRVKIPRWIRQYTGKNIEFEVNAGPYLSRDVNQYKLAIACGGCMINKQEMMARISDCRTLGIPITNYGVAISYVQGVLKRVIAPFPETQGIF
jgi:[FeFe] hydrogenase H-cluster maturation GTPase HydF